MILHVDMDAFYASVEQRDNPSLRRRAVAVGGSPTGRGVVSAASYEAREFGVHSAMSMKRAVALCPQLVIVKTRMSHYADISRKIRSIFQRYSPLVEPLALDEAFLDVSGTEKLFGSAQQIGVRIQAEILEELSLPASVGVAPNKFLAKVASGHDKPNGFVVVSADRIQEFLDPLPVEQIWGVGGRARGKLEAIGVHKVRDLRQRTVLQLSSCFGEQTAAHLKRLAEGIDARQVVPDRAAKSISHETTFREDVIDHEVLRGCLLQLTEQVTRRLRRHERLAATLSIKIRWDDFQTIIRSHTLPQRSDSTSAIWRAIRRNLLPRIDWSRPVRLVGMGVSSLSASKERQLELFDDTTQKESRLDKVTDRINEQFGSRAIRRGSSRK